MNAVQSGFDAHIVSPLQAVRNELFATYRARPGIVSAQEFAADKASLLRMLQDFQKDAGKISASWTTPSSAGPSQSAVSAASRSSAVASVSGGAGSSSSSSFGSGQARSLSTGAGADALTVVDEAALLSGMQVGQDTALGGHPSVIACAA